MVEKSGRKFTTYNLVHSIWLAGPGWMAQRGGGTDKGTDERRKQKGRRKKEEGQRKEGDKEGGRNEKKGRRKERRRKKEKGQIGSHVSDGGTKVEAKMSQCVCVVCVFVCAFSAHARFECMRVLCVRRRHSCSHSHSNTLAPRSHSVCL